MMVGDMMTTKRFTVPIKYVHSHSKIQLNGEPLTNAELVRILNTNDGAFVENFFLTQKIEQLQKELEYIQNSITEHIKHQKTELGQKALKEIIADYNEWMLGHTGLEE